MLKLNQSPTFSYTGLTQQEADLLGKLVGNQPMVVLHQHGASGLFDKLHQQFTEQMTPPASPPPEA